MPIRFLNILPDPNYTITPGGFGWDETTGGEVGQGFASVKLSEKKLIKKDRTIGGKVINRTKQAGKWIIDITYNPMTREEFLPVFNFLLQHQGSRKAFFVSLPQHAAPQDSAFATWVTSGTLGCQSDALGGATSIEIVGPADWETPIYSNTGLPTPGDMFTLSNLENSLFTKAYIVTHVETENLYQTVLASGWIRVHFSPGLYGPWVDTNVAMEFDVPLIRVVQVQDVQEYALSNNNLYSFSLKLEEALF